MGRYLNPKNTPKEVWLFDNGFLVPNPKEILVRMSNKDKTLGMIASVIVDNLVDGANDAKEKIDNQTVLTPAEKDKVFFNDYVIVDLINNGPFRAAAVYTSRSEVLEIYDNKSTENDERQRLWFIVDREKALAEVRPFPSN